MSGTVRRRTRTGQAREEAVPRQLPAMTAAPNEVACGLVSSYSEDLSAAAGLERSPGDEKTLRASGGIDDGEKRPHCCAGRARRAGHRVHSRVERRA